jgi:hypothetical protein
MRKIPRYEPLRRHSAGEDAVDDDDDDIILFKNNVHCVRASISAGLGMGNVKINNASRESPRLPLKADDDHYFIGMAIESGKDIQEGLAWARALEMLLNYLVHRFGAAQRGFSIVRSPAVTHLYLLSVPRVNYHDLLAAAGKAELRDVITKWYEAFKMKPDLNIDDPSQELTPSKWRLSRWPGLWACFGTSLGPLMIRTKKPQYFNRVTAVLIFASQDLLTFDATGFVAQLLANATRS